MIPVPAGSGPGNGRDSRLDDAEIRGGGGDAAPHDHDPKADALGLGASRALGPEPSLVLKTLMV